MIMEDRTNASTVPEQQRNLSSGASSKEAATPGQKLTQRKLKLIKSNANSFLSFYPLPSVNDCATT